MNFGKIINLNNGNRAVVVHTKGNLVWVVVEGTTATILSNLAVAELEEMEEKDDAKESMHDRNED